jgi:GntR family transcriptional regulator
MPSANTREPVYQTLSQRLRALIGSPEFPLGSRFLTEREVSLRFQVSRATANKALSNLASEGLLEFRKGVGTFTRGRAIDLNLRALVSFTEEATAAGKQPATRLLSFARQTAADAPVDAAQHLHAAARDELLALERLRLADGVPVILERRWVVAALWPGVQLEDLGGSLYAAWARKAKLPIEGADQTIRAVAIRGREAALLDVREGEAGLLITSTGYLAGRVPFWFERTLYRGDAYEFHNRLGGIQSAAHAGGKFLETVDPL